MDAVEGMPSKVQMTSMSVVVEHVMVAQGEADVQVPVRSSMIYDGKGLVCL